MTYFKRYCQGRVKLGKTMGGDPIVVFYSTHYPTPPPPLSTLHAQPSRQPPSARRAPYYARCLTYICHALTPYRP